MTLKRILRRRPSPATAIAITALVVALGGVAFATIPDSSGTIHGCFDRKGDLRVVESASDCRKKETPIEWNEKGPKGDPGSPGGSAVVARARGTSSQATTNSFADYPLSNNNWTQQADETDLILGQVAFTPPASCGTGIHSFFAEILLDGQPVAHGGDTGSEPGNPFSSPQQTGLVTIFEPGSSGSRTITARIKDDCTTGQHFTVNSISVNVLGFR